MLKPLSRQDILPFVIEMAHLGPGLFARSRLILVITLGIVASTVIVNCATRPFSLAATCRTFGMRIGNGPGQKCSQERTMKLYHHPLSGHSHRARLFLSLLGLPYELVEVDLKSGAHKKPEFLKLNPFGQVPVLEDNDVVIADSNAILVYLAKKAARTDWLPEDAKGAAALRAANGRSIKCCRGGKINPRPMRVNTTRAVQRIASCGR